MARLGEQIFGDLAVWSSGSMSLSVFISPALAHAPQDRLPKSDTVAPKIGQYGPAQADMIASQDADLRVWVELRGFEPLTPSMLTQCSAGQTGQVTASAQVSGLRTVTITASDAT
jgi:hypothetical protein